MRYLLIVLLFLFCGCLVTRNYDGKEWEGYYYSSKSCDADIMGTEITCYERVGLKRLLSRTPIP